MIVLARASRKPTQFGVARQPRSLGTIRTSPSRQRPILFGGRAVGFKETVGLECWYIYIYTKILFCKRGREGRFALNFWVVCLYVFCLCLHELVGWQGAVIMIVMIMSMECCEVVGCVFKDGCCACKAMVCLYKVRLWLVWSSVGFYDVVSTVL